MSPEAPESLVQALAQILHSYGDTVLDGSHVLTLLTPCLQVVTRLFEQLFPRGPGSGFQALPAHPADSFPILRAQFLLDMLQKTPSLKLIHPSECPRQFDVNIFPFKSLRHLEMCHLPPHCLRGLCSVYSQMEVLTCTRCVSSLEEVISGCGGDLNSALPWLELHTLDFSYNMIKNLDSSLELLNSLKILNLSHNQIAECGSYLKVLSELQYLNLGYNCLSVVPELNVGSTAKLHSLILRYNQLSSTSGIENLHNLQHLDLSYNLLLEHTELSGLSGLHNLKKLYLAGNPLFFHRDYRTVTAQHLSLKASDKVLLDGKFLSISEIMKAQARGEVRVQPSSSVTESSCTGDLTDSCSAAEISAPRIPRKKSKVRVRTASISERSDSEYEQRGPAIEPVLQHQKDIERTDSFREQFGVNWLQYRPHLESELDPDYLTRQSPTPPRQSPSPAVPNTDAERNSPSPVLDCTNQDPDMLISTEKKLIDQTEESLQEQVWELQGTTEPVDEEVLIGDALCSPVVVCPVLNGQPRNPDWPWVFLRIIPHYLLEIDPENGRILLKRELGSLRGIQTSHTQWDCHGKVQDLPLLTLSFESVCEERQTVNYVVLDNSPEISATTLLDLLRPVLEENQREKSEAQEDLLRLQCLKCKTEFSQQEDTGELPSMQCTREEERNETARTGEAEGGRALHRHHTGEASCPSCGSVHIILAPAIPRGEGSSPLHPAPVTQSEDGGEQGSKSFYLSDDESDPMTAPCDEESTVTFYSFDNEDQGSQAAPDSNGSSKDSSSHYSQLLSPSVGSTQALDFHFVDHRLKLYLDMEILVGESEEFLCYIKAPLVHFGKTSEFWSLVVVSNEKIYFLEITGETRGDTCDWLRPGDSQDLSLLTHLHFGTQEQSLSLGFEDCGAAYTLLIRNRHHCKAFAKHLLDKVSELPARYRSNIQHSSEENLTAQHRLWPLVHDKHGISESSRPPDCLYVLLFFQREDVVSTKTDQSYPTTNVHLPPPNTASPVALEQGASSASPRSLLLTQTHMYLLVEDHQWMYGAPSRECRVDSRATVEVKEKQPISNISSVHLFQCAALHLRIHLYNETQQSESAWLLWTEDPEMPRQIVDWLRTPWEAEYHIHLNPVIHRTL